MNEKNKKERKEAKTAFLMQFSFTLLLFFLIGICTLTTARKGISMLEEKKALYDDIFRKQANYVRCQIKVHNCKYSYLCCNFILLFSEILLLIEFCFIISLIFLIFSPCPKYTSLGVRLSNDS